MFVTLMQKVTHQLYNVYESVAEFPDPKKREIKYNALAHILPDIGKVTELTLKNVRDLDVGGHPIVKKSL